MIRLKTILILAPLAFVQVYVTAPCGAQDKVDEEAAKKQAKIQSKQAAIHYNLGRFKQAIASYTEAYESYPAPEILFNLAQCYRQVGDHEKALFFFEGYIREMPEAPNRQVVLELIEESKKSRDKVQADQERLAKSKEKQREKELEIALNSKKDGTRHTPIYENPWLWVAVAGAAAISIAITAAAMSPRSETFTPSGTLGTADRR